MSEEKVKSNSPATTTDKPTTARPKNSRFDSGMRRGNDNRQKGGRGRRPTPREKDEFDQVMIDLARVTRVMAGGKRMRFRACMIIGDRKGKIGWAVAKGADVSIAINKAVNKAKKHLITVKTVDGTIPHPIKVKFKAARVLIKPAKKGSGIKAGGAVRSVLALSGIQDVSAKILGSNNKINNVQAVFKALANLKYGQRLEKSELVKEQGANVAADHNQTNKDSKKTDADNKKSK